MNSYDTEGNGEMTLSELASAMGEVVGLTKEDVMPMFSQAGKLEDVSFYRKNEFDQLNSKGTNVRTREGEVCLARRRGCPLIPFILVMTLKNYVAAVNFGKDSFGTRSLVGDDIKDSTPLSFAPHDVTLFTPKNFPPDNPLRAACAPSTTRDIQQDYITASEFADTLMEFVNSDSSIQSLVQAI